VRTKVRTVRSSHPVSSHQPPGSKPAHGCRRRVFFFQDTIFEYAQRRVPQGRGADSLRPQSAHAHSDAQITKIAASIVEYGWTNPILVDGDNGIIAGHGRLAAARKLGLDQVPVIELAHLTTAQKRALVIADNRLALDAGWDEEMLALELAELSEAGFELALTGFENIEIDALLADAQSTEGEPAAQDGAEAPTNPIRPMTYLTRQWWRCRARAMSGPSARTA
jgi:hypothetical protein